MHLVLRAFGLLGLAAALAFAAEPSQAELTADQNKSIAEIARMLREAGAHYKAGDFQTSGTQVEAAMEAIDALIAAGGQDAYDALTPAFPLIIDAHTRLELEGVMLRPFERPKLPDAGPMEQPAAKPTSTPASPKPKARTRGQRRTPMPEPAVTGPSFVREVAPILVQHCGRCHISATRGDFSMATFALLAKGPPEGRVVFPGDVVASRLIETIETGDMPRGGGKVPPAQLQLLKDWVLAGANDDGPSPTIPLTSMAATSPPVPPGVTPQMPPTNPSARRATGSETVSFANDIAPILLQNCNGCHIDAMQARGGLRMDTFDMLIRGGDSGEIVAPNRAAASLLVRKLKGEEGQRMPAGGRPPLSNEAVGLISTWIEEGATFDGESADQPLEVMASVAWAKSASDDQLSQRREESARKNLELIGAGPDKLTEFATDRFLILGDVSQETAQAVSTAAAKAMSKIKSFADPAAIRGRVTIFAFTRRYEYSEFAEMVERRRVPADWRSHWKHEGADLYIATLAAPSDSGAAIEARLIGPLTSLAVTVHSSDVPRWFAEGVGRAAAAKLASRELASVAVWNNGLPAAVAALKDGTQLVKNGLPPEQTDLIGYAIASTMLGRNQRRQYDTLLRQLDQMPSFDAAFLAAFGVNPESYIDRWKVYVTSGIDSRRR